MIRAKLRLTKSKKAGLIFPVTRILKRMKKSGLFRIRRFETKSAVYLSAVIEYLAREIAELAGDVARQQKRKVLLPRHVMLAVLTDSELNASLKNVTFPFSGVMPQLFASQMQAKLSTVQRTMKTVVPSVTRATAKTRLRKVPSLPSQPAPLSTLSKKQITVKTSLSVVQGDLTKIKASVAVHPTSNSAGFGGMVGQALRAVGGQILVDLTARSIRDEGCIEENGVRLTPTVNLPFPWLLHVVSPSWNSGNPEGCKQQLSSLVRKCLEVCDQRALTTVAMPSISSGGNGFPKLVAARAIMHAIKEYCDLNAHATKLEEVIFVLYDQESVQVYISELKRLQ